MTRFYRSLLVVAWCLLLCAPAFAAPEKAQADGSHVVTFSVPDMECSMCVRSIQLGVKRVEGVLEVKVDDIHHTTTVKFDPSKTDVKTLQAALKKAGFASHVVEPGKG